MQKIVLSLESPTIFDERYKVTFFYFGYFSDFNLLSCELDNSTFNVLYWVILSWCYIEVKKN